MRRHGHNAVCPSLSWKGASPLLLLLLLWPVRTLRAQDTDQQALAQKVQQLTDAMARTQAQLEESQRQLEEIRRQLDALRVQMQQGTSAATTTKPAPSTNASSSSSSAIDDIRERQAMQEAQIATHEQAKVESVSKYPVKVTGLLLLNGFANSGAVDMPATPTATLPGGGTTGASVRQTILGFDARGPHIFGAQSSADLRVDFDGTPASTITSSTYDNSNATLLRLRTAHVRLQWNHTEAYFSLDRPIINPDSPSSLTAVAEPALAWSGNLYAWNPQLGVTQDMDLPGGHALRLQAALIDPGDAPASAAVVSGGNTSSIQPTATESSRYPGLEARVALLGSRTDDDSNHIGFGGYFSPHLSSIGRSFDSWAATLDARVHLPLKLELTGNFYRGLGLGGLGGDAYKDFAYSEKSDGSYYFRALSDVGGWTELKRRFGQRFEVNAALGIDNVFANDLRRYAYIGAPLYLDLARNRTFTGNVIYSPTAYLLFSVEYRRLNSWQLSGPSAGANITGVAVGYKF